MHAPPSTRATPLLSSPHPRPHPAQGGGTRGSEVRGGQRQRGVGSFGEVLARAAVPLAALAAVGAFAAQEVDRTGAAETGYLGGMAAAALAAVAALAPPPALELGLGATLAVTLLWTLPDGPGRGAAVGLLLTAVFAISAARRLARTLPDLPVGVAIPLALGLQILLRGDLLLAPHLDLRTLAILLGMPLAAGVALTLLARRHGGGLALLAGGTAALLAPGWTTASTLALVALAAGDALGQEPRLKPLARVLAAFALLVPLAWEPRAGLLGAVAGLALAAPGAALLPALGLALLARQLPPAPGALGFGIVTLFLLVPALVPPVLVRWRRPAAALLLTIAARAVPGPAALAAPLALAALGVRRRGAGAAAQWVWTGALLLGSCLLASYPWLRLTPLVDLVALLGPVRTVAFRAVVLVFVLDLGTAFPRWPIRRPAHVAALALFLALLFHLPPDRIRLLRPEQGIRIDTASPFWVTDLPGTRGISALVIESTLSNGAALPPGTPVATVTLIDPPEWRVFPGEHPDQILALRAGEDTGEWAARRPDVAQAAITAGNPAPRPWMTWVAGDFFGQRYRSRLRLPRPSFARSLRIERLPSLQPGVEIAIQQIEVER